jgi:hypothetical protein
MRGRPTTLAGKGQRERLPAALRQIHVRRLARFGITIQYTAHAPR